MPQGGQKKLNLIRSMHSSSHPKHGPVSKHKAKEIMKHGEVHGKKLTKKQRGLFGLIAGGRKPRY